MPSASGEVNRFKIEAPAYARHSDDSNDLSHLDIFKRTQEAKFYEVLSLNFPLTESVQRIIALKGLAKTWQPRAARKSRNQNFLRVFDGLKTGARPHEGLSLSTHFYFFTVNLSELNHRSLD